MKTIFLDIDGVINTEHYITTFWDICSKINLTRPEAAKLRMDILRDDYGNLFCPLAVRNLAWIIEITGAKIVISSTWRGSGLSIMKDMWKDRNLPGEVIDTTPFSTNRFRGEEIKEWLLLHPEVEQYVIFDDDNDMLPEQLNNFIQTEEVYGITFKDSQKAIQILNS